MGDAEKREKIIKGLECCSAYDYRCNDCPYQDDGGAEDDCYSDELYADALALLKALTAFKRYFDGLYGQGLEVANWHMNGATEPFDGFYDSAMEEYENGREAVRPVRVGL